MQKLKKKTKIEIKSIMAARERMRQGENECNEEEIQMQSQITK